MNAFISNDTALYQLTTSKGTTEDKYHKWRLKPDIKAVYVVAKN